MNITIANRRPRGISLKAGYIASIAGAAIAGSLLLAASWPGAGNVAVALTQPSIVRQVDRSMHYIYVVAGETERTAILDANAELSRNADRPALSVFVACETDLLLEATTSMAAAAYDFTVVDVTPRSRP